MATIFERLTGINLPEDPAGPEEQKTGIHPLGGCLNFYGTGDVTGANIAIWFDLVGEQRDDVIYMSQLAQDAQDVNARNKWMRIWKDFLYCGESRVAADPWEDELTFWQTLRSAVTEAGGTPTPIPQYLLDRFGL